MAQTMSTACMLEKDGKSFVLRDADQCSPAWLESSVFESKFKKISSSKLVGRTSDGVT